MRSGIRRIRGNLTARYSGVDKSSRHVGFRAAHVFGSVTKQPGMRERKITTNKQVIKDNVDKVAKSKHDNPADGGKKLLVKFFRLELKAETVFLLNFMIHSQTETSTGCSGYT